MDLPTLPFVSIITVNFNGKFFLKNLFNSLLDLNYPKEKLQIIMVDNGSTDDSVSFVKENYPFVEIIKNKENKGFAEGNNIGIKAANGEFIALINNDCVVDSQWLLELVKGFAEKENGFNVISNLDNDKNTNSSKNFNRKDSKLGQKNLKVGGVGSKVLFYFKYIPLTIVLKKEDAELLKKEGTEELFKNNNCFFEEPKIKLSNKGLSDLKDLLDVEENYVKKLIEFANGSIKYTLGFGLPQKGELGNLLFKIKDKAQFAVPIIHENIDLEIEINLHNLDKKSEITFLLGQKILLKKSISHSDEKINLVISSDEYKKAQYIINSFGSKINKSFYAKEIGYEEYEDSFFAGTFNSLVGDEKIKEVFALPGTSFLIKRNVIDEIGLFDRWFFTYYEDIDFFFRARLKGYRFFVTKDSAIRHFHCGTGIEWSYSFTYYVLRNRLLMIYKNVWKRAFLKNYFNFLASAIVNLLYAVYRRLRGDKINRIDIPIRVRIIFEFFILFLVKFPERVKIRKSKVIKDEEIIKWQENF